MGAISYYAFPAVRTCLLSATVLSGLTRDRHYCFKQPYGTIVLSSLRTQWPRVIHGVAAFASLHCSVTFAIALFAHKPHQMQYFGGAHGFSLEPHCATVYFGWHYVVDSIAGVFIGWMCVAIGQRVTKAQPLRKRSTVLDPEEVVSSPDRVTT